MKILYACNDLDFFIAHRLFLARTMASEGHTVSLAVEDDADPKKVQGLKLIRLKLDRYRFSPLADLRLLLGYYREIKASKPDIVHAITIKPILFLSLVLLFIRSSDRPKLILTFPGLGKIFEAESGALHSLRKFIVISVLRFCQRRNRAFATFENEENRQTLTDYRIVTQANSKVLMGAGIGEEFSPPKTRKGKPVVLCAGRLLKAKGVGLYINAVEKLAAKNVAAEFLIAGEWDEKNPDTIDMNIIKESEATGIIRYLGNIPVKQMPQILRKADILCLPTLLKEGLPRIMLEAAACGCALLVSDQGSTRPFVINGNTGYRLSPVTSDKIYSGLKKMLGNMSDTRQMGKNASKLANESPIRERQIFKEFLNIYEQAIDTQA